MTVEVFMIPAGPVACPETVTVDDVFLLYGRAVYLASALEKAVAVVVSGGDSTALDRIGRERYAFFLDDRGDGRFRRLMDGLSARMSLDGQFEIELAEALRNRNTLAHEFWWEHSGEMESADGRRSIFMRLGGLCGQFGDLLSVFTPVA